MEAILAKVAKEVLIGVKEGGDFLNLTHKKFFEHGINGTPENRGYYIHQVAALINEMPHHVQ